MKQSYTTSRTVLHVTGFLWSGPKCSHEYLIKGDIAFADLAEACRATGDFESLTSAKLVTTVKEVTETVTTRKIK